MSVRIAPSILSADFAKLGEGIAAVERGGADLIHVDVMDGHFVPNITIGPPVVQAIMRVATVPLDVHLMITDPDRYIEAFAKAGAAMISVHVEVLPHLHRTVHAIKALGARAGVVINPATPVHVLEDIATDVDFVLVMSVNPGFGGQTFISRSESKVRDVRRLLDAAANPAPVEIDGGIDRSNVASVVAAGARILVAGSAIFHAADPERATRELKAAAVAALGNADNSRGVGTGVALSALASSSRVRVRYAETDQMGVVYHANYFVWFEVGRTDLLRHAGWTYRDMEADGYSLPVLEAHCNFRQPARYDDELDVRTDGALLSPVRVQFTYDLVRPADNTTLATAHTIHAAVQRDGRPCRLPERVRALFSASDPGKPGKP